MLAKRGQHTQYGDPGKGLAGAATLGNLCLVRASKRNQTDISNVSPRIDSPEMGLRCLYMAWDAETWAAFISSLCSRPFAPKSFARALLPAM